MTIDGNVNFHKWNGVSDFTHAHCALKTFLIVICFKHTLRVSSKFNVTLCKIKTFYPRTIIKTMVRLCNIEILIYLKIEIQ